MAGGLATSIFIAGWATGGLIFGMLGDRIGRVKTMVMTVLMYSLCTGLSCFSQTTWDFAFYRFLTGLGVGGEFAVGVALVAEVMPDAARTYALALLQALSGIGNVTAAVIFLGLGLAQDYSWLPHATERLDVRLFVADHVHDWRRAGVPGLPDHATAQGAGPLGSAPATAESSPSNSARTGNCSACPNCAARRSLGCFWAAQG